MTDNEYEWLNKLKVGDKVGWYDRYNSIAILRVRKVTQTQIVTQFTRFRKKDGFMVGAQPSGIYSMTHICEYTRDFQKKFMLVKRRRHLQNMLSKQSFDKFDLQDIENIIGILNKYLGDEP